MKIIPKPAPPRRSTRSFLIAALLASAVGQASASEPLAPVEYSDRARLSELELTLSSGLAAADVAVSLVFNRFQGRLVDEGARLVGGNIDVRRAVQVQDLGGGRARISLAPVAAGIVLPDGLYGQLLEIEAQPRVATLEPFLRVHPLYFQVVGGVVTRLDMSTYSDRLEPLVAGLDKNRRPIMLQAGAPASAAAAPVGQVVEVQVERGDAFAQPGDERLEN